MVRLSLRTKIMICCIGLVALLDLMVVIFVRSRLSVTLRAEYLTKGRNIAANLAARSEHFVLTEDFVSLLQLVKDLKSNDEDVAYAYVADRKDRVLAHTFSGGFPVDLVGVNNLQPEDTWRDELLDTEEEGLVHDIGVPILQGKVGSVHIGISEHRIQQTISHFTLALIAIAGFALLVAVSLAAVLSWAVTQPIHSLIKAAQKIRDGDLGHQVAATTKDEVGDLVESFNQMSNELLKQHRVLDDRNRHIRMAQEQAAWERDKLRAIIDSMVESIIFIDNEGKISLCNQSTERIWNTSAQQLLGKPVSQLPSAELRATLGKILRQARQKPGFITSHSVDLRDGCCLTNYSTVHDEKGRYLGLVFLSLDISERVALEQEQKRLRDQLFQQEKIVLIGQIAASVAHELNTPLATILLRAQLMQKQLGHACGERSRGDGESSDLGVIENEAQRCRRIIESLLGFSRRSEGLMTIADVNSLVAESLFLVENDLALKGISLETDYASNAMTIRADRNEIQQVLLNLVTNAADAMPNGGHLRITTRLLSEQGRVEIRVTDNGCGMRRDVVNRAFDPFFTTKKPGKGTGLGLAICRRVVQEYNGEIEIQSQPGQGTTVLVCLPYIPTEVTADE
ncbi:MAG: ATP-binding protein [Sedimentisphaerales bacterium]